MAKRQWRIWHATGASFSSLRESHEWVACSFDLVALVEAKSLDEAYRLTNHTAVDWTTNEGVRALVESPRSTSVGDVVEADDGRAYYCRPLGWKSREGV